MTKSWTKTGYRILMLLCGFGLATVAVLLGILYYQHAHPPEPEFLTDKEQLEMHLSDRDAGYTKLCSAASGTVGNELIAYGAGENGFEKIEYFDLYFTFEDGQVQQEGTVTGSSCNLHTLGEKTSELYSALTADGQLVAIVYDAEGTALIQSDGSLTRLQEYYVHDNTLAECTESYLEQHFDQLEFDTALPSA